MDFLRLGNKFQNRGLKRGTWKRKKKQERQWRKKGNRSRTSEKSLDRTVGEEIGGERSFSSIKIKQDG